VKTLIRSLFLTSTLLSFSAFAAESGSPAPDFTALSSEGKEVKLSDYKGKVVVLEWLNYGCPFVKKHYEGKNMQKLQAEITKQGVVWLSVISSAPGAQGHSDAAQAEKDRKEHGSKATAVLLDEKGLLGKAYNAQTTPHMFVIDAKGTLVYQGAIDDQPSADSATLKNAKDYVSPAVKAALAGKEVKTAQTKAYGCSVKYN